MTHSLTLRTPSTYSSIQQSARDDAAVQPPPLSWLTGTWTVTHSSLPMWRTKRNVRITYNLLPAAEKSSTEAKLDDLVTYQALSSSNIKTVRGIDTAVSGSGGWGWQWRGKGWLVIASSQWEVLGYGTEGEEEWVVTYFAKTLFTPAGVDVYSRSEKGLSGELFKGIMVALEQLAEKNESLRKIIGELREVRRDSLTGGGT